MANLAYWAYVGTYTGSGSEGIYVYHFDAATGVLERSSAARTEEPSFLAFHPSGRFLYAVNERGRGEGALSAFVLEPATGELTLLNQQSSQGSSPCYVSVDPTGHWAVASNYGSGSLVVLPIGPDGRLGPVSDLVQHRGSGPNTKRQEAPHPHCAILDPSGRYVVCCDLGSDRAMVYRLDEVAGKLLPHVEPWVLLHPGAGPRHISFHPNGHYAYVINELDSTLTALAYDGRHGAFRALETVPTLPEGYRGENTCADVHVHPAGHFLYGSNRGHDSIVIWAIDETSGKLHCVGHEPTRGQTPRNFAIIPEGNWLLVANQNSETLVVFHVDAETGLLTATSQVDVPRPVCVRLWRREVC